MCSFLVVLKLWLFFRYTVVQQYSTFYAANVASNVSDELNNRIMVMAKFTYNSNNYCASSVICEGNLMEGYFAIL